MSTTVKITYMKFNELIRKKRKDLGLTQVEVAKFVGVSATAIVQWEKGDTKPNGDNLMNLAQILKSKPEELVQNKRQASIMEPSAPYQTDALSREQLELLDYFEKADKAARKVALRILKSEK